MIEQFHKILRTPKHTPAELLNMTQDLIICTFQQIFPETIDLQSLHRIFQQILGDKALGINGEAIITIQQQILLNYQLLKHFIDQIKIHFIGLDIYNGLQVQTQRAQSTIRSHIKIQQQMKMYLQYLQSKIQKIQRQLNNTSQSPEVLHREIQILQNRQSVLQRQKINLIKKNQNLTNQLQQLKMEMQKLGEKQKSIKGSLIFQRYINEGQMSTKLKLFSDKMALVESKKIKLQKNQSQNLKEEKQIYRLSGHDYDLTQKKRSGYFPLSNS